MTNASWQAQAGSKVYHAEAVDWVKSGRAMCGTDLRHTATITNHVPTNVWWGRACKKCLKELNND